MEINSLIAYEYNLPESSIRPADGSTGTAKSNEDPIAEIKEKVEVDRLEATEREVIAHELAHSAVGGRFAGAPSYTYTTGPDGKRYISGGEVSISMPSGKTPEETVQNMRQVRAAALAPANPSSQDLSIAARASAIETKAASEAAQEKSAEGLETENSDSTPEILPTQDDGNTEAYANATEVNITDPGDILSLLV